MSSVFHPFFVEFSSFLNDVENVTTTAKDETIIPFNVRNQTDKETLLFESYLNSVESATENLWTELDNVPLASSIIDPTNTLINVASDNLTRLSKVLLQYVSLSILLVLFTLYF